MSLFLFFRNFGGGVYCFCLHVSVCICLKLLQYEKSKLTQVMFAHLKPLYGLKELSIHALPIHDAVVVGRVWVDMRRLLMEQVFLDITNVES